MIQLFSTLLAAFYREAIRVEAAEEIADTLLELLGMLVGGEDDNDGGGT